MKKPSKDFLVVMAFIAGLFIATVIWASRPKPNFSHTKTGDVHRDLLAISTAVSSYQSELNSDPPLPLKEFYASLEGENSKGFRFLSSGRRENSTGGLMCDAWDTPYQVYMSRSGWLIRSAGPNRSFDDIKNVNQASPSDDISVFVPRSTGSLTQQDGAGHPPTLREFE